MTKLMGSCIDLATTAESKKRNQGGGASDGSDPRLGRSRRVEEKAPLNPHRGVYSGVGVVLYGFQMKGLETVSVSRRNGRDPDSSFKRLWISGCNYTRCSLMDSHPVIACTPQICLELWIHFQALEWKFDSCEQLPGHVHFHYALCLSGLQPWRDLM